MICLMCEGSGYYQSLWCPTCHGTRSVPDPPNSLAARMGLNHPCEVCGRTDCRCVNTHGPDLKLPWRFVGRVSDRQPYEVMLDRDNRALFDTLNSDVTEVRREDDEDGHRYWDETGRHTFQHIAALVNLGIPASTLANRANDGVAALAIEYLKDPGEVTLGILRDECEARQTGGADYVPRAELVRLLRVVKEACDGHHDPLGMMVSSSSHPGGVFQPTRRFISADILDAVRAAVAKEAARA